MQSAVAYHLREAVNDLPLVPAPSGRILDVGCGIGQHLVKLTTEAELHGVDIDGEAIAYGQEKYPILHLAVGGGEHLFYPDAHFNQLICRVSLPYMDVPRAIAEFSRVLKPRASLWLSLHDFGFYLRALRSQRHIKGFAYHVYILLNSLCLMLFGKCFRMPLTHRMESFQTEAAIRALLTKYRFANVSVQRGREFIITANRE